MPVIRYPAAQLLVVVLLALAAVPARPQPLPAPMAVLDHDQPLRPAFTLPATINETSGLVYHADGFWTFNDSGGKPELYKLDAQTGTIVQTVVLTGAENRDWEDMCQDEDYFYVGDFGNNRGNRRDLRVYRVAKAGIGKDPAVRLPADVIAFRYADQTTFDVRDRDHDFDCESVVSTGDELLLFSKNWVTGRTRMYRMSKEPGSYVLPPVDEFDAGGLVTGADFCSKNDMLALVGYTDRVPFVILFADFGGKSMDRDHATRINFSDMHNAQTEGICFVDEHRLAITAESTRQFPQALYMLPLEVLLKTSKKD